MPFKKEQAAVFTKIMRDQSANHYRCRERNTVQLPALEEELTAIVGGNGLPNTAYQPSRTSLKNYLIAVTCFTLLHCSNTLYITPSYYCSNTCYHHKVHFYACILPFQKPGLYKYSTVLTIHICSCTLISHHIAVIALVPCCSTPHS